MAQQFQNSCIKRVLVISPEQALFRQFAAESGFETVFCDNILDAIVVAAKGNYDFILIQMAAITGRHDQTLAAIRKANQSARLVLLSSMLEEPLALRLIHNSQGGPLADEYLIFPSGIKDWVHTRFNLTILTDNAAVSSVQMLSQLEKLAVEDDLTGLKNRRYLKQFFKQILEQARKDKFNVTLLLFDIDNFKPYNDQYGHPVGDEVLRQVGEMIKRSCREHDVVARVGGDEFAVVFWDLTSTSHGEETVEERRKRLSEHPRETVFMAQRFRRQLSMANLSMLGSCGKGRLTISGGLASFPKDGEDEQQLFIMADQAMLHAKRCGKNRIHIVGTPE
jgi:diguanylate cyclase (GGDEF)-like protein